MPSFSTGTLQVVKSLWYVWEDYVKEQIPLGPRVWLRHGRGCNSWADSRISLLFGPSTGSPTALRGILFRGRKRTRDRRTDPAGYSGCSGAVAAPHSARRDRLADGLWEEVVARHDGHRDAGRHGRRKQVRHCTRGQPLVTWSCGQAGGSRRRRQTKPPGAAPPTQQALIARC